ncbi:hypothetical protein BCR42DRAFT_453439 [Absidia repens]|uniref:Uncharacterized protein n=1 Tax=Absidia repens TaxID=90262 RepID=A0A1X2IBV2_9FUNG|nr:hypothetical protein BCR42DRAFT_453439 [Absidia repens]
MVNQATSMILEDHCSYADASIFLRAQIFAKVFVNIHDRSTTQPNWLLLIVRKSPPPNNLVTAGRAFVSNPDLAERFRNHWELIPYNHDTFYSPGPEAMSIIRSIIPLIRLYY